MLTKEEFTVESWACEDVYSRYANEFYEKDSRDDLSRCTIEDIQRWAESECADEFSERYEKYKCNFKAGVNMKFSIENLKIQLRNAYGESSRINAIIDDSVWTGDPYGWASGADVTISMENGLPSYENYQFWDQIEFEDAYCEPVNMGVMAIYKDK